VKRLHIISFNNPYPPHYGGVQDVFYKIKALHQEGVRIVLHIFIAKPAPPDFSFLSAYCEEVYFYRRKKTIFKLFSPLPFRILSRNAMEIYSHLEKNQDPVLFEGLQSTYLLMHCSFENRAVLLRAHNKEHLYLYALAKSERNILKKVIYFVEALKMKRYEPMAMAKITTIISLAMADDDYFKSRYKNQRVYIPVFHGNETVKKLSGKGAYAFYHGDLSISDNLKAVRFLISVFSDIDFPLFIAGSKNLKRVRKWIGKKSHIRCVLVQNSEELLQMLENAHINVLVSFQPSGAKLKLVNALFNSRFCVINSAMIPDVAIGNLCHLANSPSEFKKTIRSLATKSYDEYETRKKVLSELLDNRRNARQLTRYLV
jgi:hypothetical protein